MSQWFTLFNKELLEMSRNFKWIWFPITFILLGVSDPLTTYYMPQILDAVGGLPEGAVIQLPTPSAPEVLYMTLDKYNTLGILIIILSTMGLISSERKSGVAGLILVKPVSFASYVTAKWAGALILIWCSYFLGYVTSWYYVGILFERIPFTDFIQSFLLFGLWLTVVLTITLFFNTFFKSPGPVGFLSLAVVIVLSIVSGTLSNIFEWSPSQLTSYTLQMLVEGRMSDGTMATVLVSITTILLLIVMTVLFFRKRELAA